MDSPVVVGIGSQFSSPEPDHLVLAKKFYQGEPVALGITQIFIGITGIVFGILVNLMDTDSSYFLLLKISYWGGILVVVVYRNVTISSAK